MIQLQNESLRAQIAEVGAELVSLRLDGGDELIWQADPAYWPEHAPLLFPFCGAVYEDRYSYEGTSYTMGIHGFARFQTFALTQQCDTEAWFQLTDTEETRAVYPFAFRLDVGYRLEGDALRVLWRVTNSAERELLFSIGAHPGFCCELANTEVCFEPRRESLSVENLAGRAFTDTHKSVALQNGRLPLSAALFDTDALFFSGEGIARVGLAERGKAPWIAVECPDFCQIGLWAAAGDPRYVCIEPWMGSPDRVGGQADLREKRDLIRLATGNMFMKEYTITCAGNRD